ncbi:MAG: hypothetical protein KME08_07710 [Aphanothece sp. CMT-3BRIN-NPC111]|nr:hypothetical protein [Aphanothece sp. CMT-3BRIN-NPC111]
MGCRVQRTALDARMRYALLESQRVRYEHWMKPAPYALTFKADIDHF